MVTSKCLVLADKRITVMNEELICIVCPMGCTMAVELANDEVKSVAGHQCKRGKEHAAKEVVFPGRILTTTVRTNADDFPLLPVRSNREIPKDKLMACMDETAKVFISKSVKMGQPVIENILDLGVDMVACRTIACRE